MNWGQSLGLLLVQANVFFSPVKPYKIYAISKTS
jgi:hypothetical protein